MRGTFLALITAALLSISCGHKIKIDPLHLYTNADGTVNVTKVIDDLEFGLKADCAIPGNVAQEICTYGTQAIAGARAQQAGDPAGVLAAVRQGLIKAVTDHPDLGGWFQWGIDLLGAVV
jgi:hypothetical protein